MDKYNKGIVAGVGLVVFIAKTFFDLDLSEQASNLVDVTIMALTAFGVYAIPNAST